MNRLNRCNLLRVIVLAELFASACLSADNYRVTEVLRVLSPVSFECRLKDFPYAGQARFRVWLKDAAPSGQRSEAESIEALRQILTSAENIELRRVKVRNYFRIEADVWVESVNVKPALEAGRFIRDTILETLQSNPEKADPGDVRTGATAKPIKVRAARSDTRFGAYNLQRLLEARVDASSLRAETPLVEALELISGSLTPRLPVVVFWTDLQNNAFVDRDTPIGVEGFGVMSAAQVLDIVLYSVSGSGMPLKFTIDGGVCKIGTVRTLSGRTTRVYSITDLLLPRANFDEDYGSAGNGAAGPARGAGGGE